MPPTINRILVFPLSLNNPIINIEIGVNIILRLDIKNKEDNAIIKAIPQFILEYPKILNLSKRHLIAYQKNIRGRIKFINIRGHSRN